MLADFEDSGMRPGTSGGKTGGIVGEPQRFVQGSDRIVPRAQFPLLGAYVAPRTATEHTLAEIWRRALDMDQVGIADKYDNLGGDSLLAAAIFAEIEKAFAVDIPIATLLDTPTVGLLARRIDEVLATRRS
jgi:acyl carrier protein